MLSLLGNMNSFGANQSVHPRRSNSVFQCEFLEGWIERDAHCM